MGDQKGGSDNPKRSLLQLLLLFVAVAGMFFAQHNQEQVGRLGRDGLWMGIGTLMALVTFLDARNGTAEISFSTYKRSEEPIAFWTAVVVLIGLSGAMIFGPLGDLLGLWKF